MAVGYNIYDKLADDPIPDVITSMHWALIQIHQIQFCSFCLPENPSDDKGVATSDTTWCPSADVPTKTMIEKVIQVIKVAEVI